MPCVHASDEETTRCCSELRRKRTVVLPGEMDSAIAASSTQRVIDRLHDGSLIYVETRLTPSDVEDSAHVLSTSYCNGQAMFLCLSLGSRHKGSMIRWTICSKPPVLPDKIGVMPLEDG